METFQRCFPQNPGKFCTLINNVLDNNNVHIKRTTLDYDNAGRLINRTETDIPTNKSRGTGYSYNSLDLLETNDGPRTDVTDVTTFTYNAGSGNLTQVSNALGHTSQITAHDASGRPLSMTDPNGLISSFSYDARGRLKTRTVGGFTTTFGYDPAGNLTSISQPNGLVLTYDYDTARRLTEVSDNLNNSIHYTMDTQGNRTQEETRDPGDVLTRTQSRIFDELSRLIQYTGGAGQVTDYGYDTNGNVVSITDGRSNTTTQAFDGLDRLVNATDAANGETDLQYDPLDQTEQVTDPNTLSTQYTVNALGDTTQINSPDTGITTQVHDSAGNVVQRTDARGITVNYTYDALNRLTSIDYPNNALDITFNYDTGTHGIGRLSGMIDDSGTTTYGYDQRGNRTQRTTIRDGVTHTIGFAYNGSNQITQITYPSGRTIDYTRDTLGRITAVSTTQNNVTQNLVSGITYKPFGPRSGLTFGNGITLTRSFDLDYRLTNQAYGSVWNLAYTQDDVDNVLTIDDNLNPVNNQTYTYDVLDRLETQSQNTTNRSFSYDGTSNRLTRTQNSATENYSYTPFTHRLASISGATAQAYSHDANGNTTQNNSFQFIYGDHNRLATVKTIGGAWVADYIYNGQGERVKKVTGSTAYYHYDLDGQLIAETDPVGQILKEYVYLDGTPIAVITGATPNTYFVHADHLNTPKVITDQNQVVVWAADAQPFGATNVTTATIPFNLRFPGQYFDQETGLHYNYFRYYDPSNGRYITSDRIGLDGGINTYGYVAGNPLKYIDPTGEFFFLIPGIPVTVGVMGDLALVGSLGWGIFNSIKGSIEWPEALGRPIDPWGDTNTEVEVPKNILPPKIPDQCEVAYKEEIKDCNSNCSNPISKAACVAKANVKRWICQGAKKTKWPDDFDSNGGDPGYTGF